MPHPGVAVILLEDLRDCPTAITRARRRVVHLVGVGPPERVGVAVTSVCPATTVGVVPSRLHAAVTLAKVRVRAVARPYMPGADVEHDGTAAEEGDGQHDRTQVHVV